MREKGRGRLMQKGGARQRHEKMEEKMERENERGGQRRKRFRGDRQGGEVS